MPRLLIEPRPYSLIRAQNNEPLFFFLACAASPPSLSATVLVTLHHHASPSSSSTNVVLSPLRLASGHAAPASRRSDWTVSFSLSATVPTTLHHHVSPSSSSTNVVLPLLHLASGHPTLTISYTTISRTSFPVFPQLSRRGSSKVNFQRVFVWFSVLYMLIFNFSYCEC